MPVLDEFISVFLVKGISFRLTIGTIVATNAWAYISIPQITTESNWIAKENHISGATRLELLGKLRCEGSNQNQFEFSESIKTKRSKIELR